MSDEQVQTLEEVVNVFYPYDNAEPLEVPTDEIIEDELPAEEEVDSIDDTDLDAEESEGSEEEADEVEDVQSVEIDGTEHNLTDIQEWKEAHDNVKLMHALPADRGHEVTDEIIDNPDISVVFDEAENRLHTAKAIMAMTM